MNDYTNAPATILVASNCACCGRPLVDANSVERGIGPDCAEKYGVPDAYTVANFDAASRVLVHAAEEGNPVLTDGVAAALVAQDAHAAANALVHWIAAQPRVEGTEAALAALHFLGYGLMANRIAKRFAKYLAERAAAREAEQRAAARAAAQAPVIEVSYEGNQMLVSCNNLTREQFAAFIAVMRSIPNRAYRAQDRVNVVHVNYKRTILNNCMRMHTLHGVRIRSERGEVVISDAA